MNFEAHITVAAKDHVLATTTARIFNWSTSSITDDPILGPGPKFYLTKHSKTRSQETPKMKRPIFLPWSLTDEAAAALKSMKKRLFWQHIALIEARHEALALQEKIDFIEKTLKAEIPPSELDRLA